MIGAPDRGERYGRACASWKVASANKRWRLPVSGHRRPVIRHAGGEPPRAPPALPPASTRQKLSVDVQPPAEVEGPIERGRAGRATSRRRPPAGRRSCGKRAIPRRAARPCAASSKRTNLTGLSRSYTDCRLDWHPAAPQGTGDESPRSASDPHSHPQRSDRPHGRGSELPPCRRHRAVESRTVAGGKDQRRPRPGLLGQPAIATVCRRADGSGPNSCATRRSSPTPTGDAGADQPRRDRPDLREQSEINERGPAVSLGGRPLLSSGSTTWRRGQGPRPAGTLPPGPARISRPPVRTCSREVTVVRRRGRWHAAGCVRAGLCVVPERAEAGGFGQEFATRATSPRGLRAGRLGAEAAITRPDGRVAAVGAGSGGASRSAPSPRPGLDGRPGTPAGYVAGRYEGRSPEDCLAYGVACGAESTQHFGAGTVDRIQVERLLGEVHVQDLEVPAEV